MEITTEELTKKIANGEKLNCGLPRQLVRSLQNDETNF